MRGNRPRTKEGKLLNDIKRYDNEKIERALTKINHSFPRAILESVAFV